MSISSALRTLRLPFLKNLSLSKSNGFLLRSNISFLLTAPFVFRLPPLATTLGICSPGSLKRRSPENEN